MKKVLYISPNGYLGGAERFILTAVKAHAKNNNIKASILFFSEGEASREAKEAGLEIFILKQSFRFRHPLNLLRALLEIRSLVRKIKPDVLQLAMPYSHISMALATFGLKNLKTVWFQHGPVGGKLDQLANFFPVDVLLFNSVDLQVRHNKTFPKAKVRIEETVINYGVSTLSGSHDLFMSAPLKLGAAGRICSWKGFHTLITAIGELKEEGQLRPFKVKLAGAVKRAHDQEYKNHLIRLTEKYKLTEEIEFLDHQKDMEQFYHQLDVFIHTSVIAEPFGLVVAEAMLNGCLVIASDVGGVTDLVINQNTGLTFPSTTSKAVLELKNILRNFLNTKQAFPEEDYKKIAIEGRSHILKNYSVEQMCTRLENLYLKL